MANPEVEKYVGLYEGISPERLDRFVDNNGQSIISAFTLIKNKLIMIGQGIPTEDELKPMAMKAVRDILKFNDYEIDQFTCLSDEIANIVIEYYLGKPQVTRFNIKRNQEVNENDGNVNT